VHTPGSTLNDQIGMRGVRCADRHHVKALAFEHFGQIIVRSRAILATEIRRSLSHWITDGDQLAPGKRSQCLRMCMADLATTYKGCPDSLFHGMGLSSSRSEVDPGRQATREAVLSLRH
jgi:hypothetical protein